MSRPTSPVEHLEAALDAEDPSYHIRSALQHLQLASETDTDPEQAVQWYDASGTTRHTLHPQWGGLVWVYTEENLKDGQWVFAGCEPVQRALAPQETEVNTDVRA